MIQLDRENGRSLREAVFAHAERVPDAQALVVRGATRSYAELTGRARRWAAAITGVARGRATRVGVFGYRSEASYAGVLAALASGAAFVPLNPTYPIERTAAMIRRARLDAIVVDKMAGAQLAALRDRISHLPPLLLAERDIEAPGDTVTVDAEALERYAPLGALPALTPDDVAYILFTSGSTGEPKGVPVTHGNVLHFLDVIGRRYGIGAHDRFSQTFDQTFDLSVFDLFLAWTHGACVYGMTPVDLLAPTGFINRHQLTVWFSVPSVVAQLRRRDVLRPASMPSLRWSLFCGEPLPRGSAEAWQAAAPGSVVENLYGPTELTIACFAHRWDPDRSPAACVNEMVPIGRPLEGLACALVGSAGEQVGPGDAGELWVTGPQTTPGYLDDAARTAERFPFMEISAGDARRFYRTGDRVVRGVDGEYAFLGRADHQIKVLGHRVELGEIEAVLLRDGAVSQAVALGWPVHEGVAQGVVAFVSGADPDADSLRRAAAADLPAYMVPTRIVVRGELPLNANGKVDRAALQLELEAVENHRRERVAV